MNRLLSPAAPLSAARPALHPGLTVFLLALAWLAGLAWMRPLALPDEGRYVGVAWEMLRSGNWVTPTLDGLPFFHKPPLFYWITATAFELLGPSEWAARSASIVAGATTVAALYAALHEWLGQRTARMAVLVLATQPLFFGASQYANLDMLVAACISVAILLGARAALRFEAGRNPRGDLAGAYVAAALGLLAKGLIGLVIPSLVLLLWLAAARRWRTLWALCWLPGFAMVGVIVVPWLAAAEWAHPGFLHYFFVVQHFQRFSGSGFNGVEPFWFYVPVLLLLVLPWSGWLFTALRRAPSVAVPPRSSANAAGPARVLALMAIWIGVVVVFFSIPHSKLVGYVLPALAPLAVLIAAAAGPLVQHSARALRWWRASAGVAALLCVGTALGVAIAHPKSSRELATQLALHRAPNDGVAFIDAYVYDLPFYLRDTAPVVVAADWDPAEIRKHDNWRKELADAGGFAPSLAADRLLGEAAFRAALCSGRVKWVVANRASVGRYPFLGEAPTLATEEDRALWHTDAAEPAFRAALGCGGTP
jgi:4-amino-4-deoxy-L-arabinose transferase-like glycosyltransferase